jgi:site-specific DNA-methyltransferase (adenine-specific)
MKYQIFNEDSTFLNQIDQNSIDAIITDPPYGINFQKHEWDKSLPNQQVWEASYRVLKPGGYMLVFSSIRLMHRMIINIEDAGFDLKDILFWGHLNGMPKSRNVALDIDKELGIESKEIGTYKYVQGYKKDKPDNYYLDTQKTIKEPASELAKKYKGAGLGLKPTYEPIILLQKPISEINIAKNIIKWGVGCLNIEETRMPYNNRDKKVGHNPHPLGRTSGNILRTENFNDSYDKFFVVPKVRSREIVEDHPTQKPIALMDHLVKLVSFTDHKVLDPFMGTGSTGVSCLNNERYFIGYEIDKTYFNIAEERLNKSRVKIAQQMLDL